MTTRLNDIVRDLMDERRETRIKIQKHKQEIGKLEKETIKLSSKIARLSRRKYKAERASKPGFIDNEKR